MQKKYNNLPLNLNPELGIVAGYASVFNVVDSQNDIVLKGAFAKTITRHVEQQTIKFLWQHQQDQPIGIVNNVIEDDFGLYIEASLLLEIEQAKEAYGLIKAGAIRGLSIGYQAVEYQYDQNYRLLSAIDLWEISLVTFPANELACINYYKNHHRQNKFEQLGMASERAVRAAESCAI